MNTIDDMKIHVPDDDIADLRQRLRSARRPAPESVDDWSQGIPLAIVEELCDHWEHRYQWRDTERRLNGWPNRCTRIAGVDVHFLHIESPRPDAIPLILTHGWPGTILEFELLIEPLTEPADPDTPAFTLVIPSLPGFGFSSQPDEPGWNVERIADCWSVLMTRLGYETFAAAGSDWGTSISTLLGLRHPHRMLGIHLIPPLAPPDPTADPTPSEQRALEDLAARSARGSGYSAVHADAPQTVGYGLVDSPSGLCAWIAEKYWTWTDHDGNLYDVIDIERVLDCISIYWFTSTASSSARLYWESIAQIESWITSTSDHEVHVPVGCSIFPAEVPRVSKRWALRRFTDIRYWAEHEHGGHFAALEQPSLVVADLRKFFQTVA